MGIRRASLLTDMAKANKGKSASNGGANLGFEAKLWLAADKLRNNMDAAEYKHVVLGLIFLKYISDTFEEHRAMLVAGKGDYAGANPEDQDEYKAENVFWVPPAARCLVEMLAPYKGRIYDPCCGSGGMFVQSEKFVEAHGGRLGDISIYGQESNATTRRLAVMNLAIRGIEADFGPEQADTFRRDLHPDLRADFVLANPPFNDSDWFRRDDDVRWQFGVPPKGNANFAWVQHFIHHLAPNGMAGFVLANGSMLMQAELLCADWATTS